MLFSVLVKATGHMSDCGYGDLTLSELVTACRAAGLDCDDEPSVPGDSEYSYLWDKGGKEPGSPWEGLQDFQASGILTRKEFDRLVDDLGAFAEDYLTMGTLGGPLGLRYVPDIPFEIESDRLIVSMRVTPVPKWELRNPRTGREGNWNRVRRATVAVYGA